MNKKLSTLLLSLSLPASAATYCEITPAYQRCPSGDASFFVQGDFLYWSAWQNELEYTWVLTPVNPEDPLMVQVNRDRKAVENAWDVGFRVGAGYLCSCSGWNFNAQWTELRATLKGSKVADGPILATLFIQPVESTPIQFGGYRAETAKGSWKLDYDTLSFDIGREYYISSCLHFHPYIGAQVAWIDQTKRGEYTNVFAFGEDEFPPFNIVPIFIGDQTGIITKDAWGIGPEFGFASFWHLSSCFQLLGEVSGAILWMDVDQQFVRQVKNNTSNPSVFDYNEVLVSNNESTIWPYARLGIGIDWNCCFFSSCVALDLQLKYEVLYWWESTSRKLSLQGLTFSGGIYF